MMVRGIIGAAAAAAFVVLAVPGVAQARMANPGLNSVAPANVQDVQYRHYRRSQKHRWYRRHHRRRHRHCWNERVRVRVPGGHLVFRTHRRCGWRYR